MQGAALQVPATDVAGWARALGRLQDDGELRNRLVELGLKRANAFPPVETARAHVELFHELLA